MSPTENTLLTPIPQHPEKQKGKKKKEEKDTNLQNHIRRSELPQNPKQTLPPRYQERSHINHEHNPALQTPFAAIFLPEAFGRVGNYKAAVGMGD